MSLGTDERTVGGEARAVRKWSPEIMRRPAPARELKWLFAVGVVYLLLCFCMLLWQPQLSVPVAVRYRGRGLREQGPVSAGQTEGMWSRHMSSLLQSQMFREQGRKLAWIGERMERMADQWEKTARNLSTQHNFLFTNSKNILLFPGLLSEYSSYDFANNAYHGGYLGELVQWSDFICTLHMLGHRLTILTSSQQLKDRVQLNRLQYDLVFTDYIGLFALRDTQHYPHYKCRIRVLDSFGTEPMFNFRTKHFQSDDSLSMFTNWNFEDTRQFWTFFPHTPDNSFLGFVVESVPIEKDTVKKNQAVLYGKEGYYAFGKEHYLNTLGEMLQLHSTFKDPGKALPSHVVNHGVLASQELKQLLSESKVFVGLGFPYDGPGPLEALAAGCAFIQPIFPTPHSRKNTAFFTGKPTTRALLSQVPYLQHFVGEPYVYTVDISNSTAVREAVYNIISGPVLSPFIPYEFTHQGMMERVGTYITKQSFCDGEDLALGKPASSSSVSAEHSAVEAVDGLLTSDSCFWSSAGHTHWWTVDLGTDMMLTKIRVTNMFEWIQAKTWNGVFLDPFSVTLTDSYGNQVASKVFRDSRTVYLWENINQRARLVRLDSLDYESPRYFVLCSVEVFGGDSNRPTWPDLTLVHLVKSSPGTSCKDSCMAERMLCEPSSFKAINDLQVLQKNFNCNGTKHAEIEYIDFAPAFAVSQDTTSLSVAIGTCVTNGNTLLLSCAGKHKNYVRLCPCRKYRSGQIALPPPPL